MPSTTVAQEWRFDGDSVELFGARASWVGYESSMILTGDGGFVDFNHAAAFRQLEKRLRRAIEAGRGDRIARIAFTYMGGIQLMLAGKLTAEMLAAGTLTDDGIEVTIRSAGRDWKLMIYRDKNLRGGMALLDASGKRVRCT
jgi:hypothetical protein